MRRRYTHPFSLRACALVLLAPAIPFATLVPDDHAAVQLAHQDRPDGDGAQPTGRPCCGRGAGTPSSLSAFVIRVRPAPADDISKMRRTTAASASLIRRSTCERSPFAPSTSRLSYGKTRP